MSPQTRKQLTDIPTKCNFILSCLLHTLRIFSREAKAAAAAGATRIKTTARRSRVTSKLISQGLARLVCPCLTGFSCEVHDLVDETFFKL